jgi:hypothetical protein
MAHLGSRVTALVDGRMDPSETERALIHVASCPRCADELAAARATRAALAQARHAPAPDPTLTVRLLSMRAEAPARPGDPFAGSDPATRAFEVRPAIERSHGRRLWTVGATLGVSVAGALFVLGSSPSIAPVQNPADVLGLLGDVASADTSETVDVDAVRAGGWKVPDELPDGWSLTGADVGETTLELDLVHVDGPTAVVTEQRGLLDRSTLADVPAVQVGDQSVLVLQYSPWTVVWQDGATVVELVAASEGPEAEQLIASFPGASYDDGIGAQIGRGWAEATRSWG